jgi:hypothetical protein
MTLVPSSAEPSLLFEIKTPEECSLAQVLLANDLAEARDVSGLPHGPSATRLDAPPLAGYGLATPNRSRDRGVIQFLYRPPRSTGAVEGSASIA